MNAGTRLFLAGAVIVSSLTCQVLAGTPESPQADMEAITRGEELLWGVINEDNEMGGWVEQDWTEDGVVDQVIYFYPIEEIQPGVRLETSLVYASGELDIEPDAGVYHKELWMYLMNDSGVETRVQFNYEIPKSFAESVDVLNFYPPPAEIVDPDPVVMYDIVLPAVTGDPITDPESGEDLGNTLAISTFTTPLIVNFVITQERMAAEALEQMRAKCKSAPPSKKNACYFSLATDFQDRLKRDEMVQICTGEMTGLERRICLAIANEKAEECDRAALPEDVLACKGFFVQNQCRKLSGGELQACLRDTSIANKAPLGCMMIEDLDVRNECYAKASGDAEFCERITNEARRENCQKALGSGGESAQSQPEADELDPSRWFNEKDAAKDCKPFAELFPEYTLTYTTGDYFHDVARLTCDMDAKDARLDDILYEVSVWVWGYPTTAALMDSWTSETEDFSYGAIVLASNNNPDLEVKLEGERYFAISQSQAEGEPVIFSITAGSLYRNARVAFIYKGFLGSETSWRLVEATFKQLIDAKNGGG